MFKTKEDFKNYLRIKYYHPENILDDTDLKKRQEEIISAWSKEKAKNPDSEMAKMYSDFFLNKFKHNINPQNPSYNEVVEILYNDICEALPQDLAKIIRDKVIVTSVDTGYINAAVHISSDREYYGIVINSALIQLLHKIGKIIYAIQNPEAVVYCNRCDVKDISKELLNEMYREYFDYFKNSKKSNGPIIHLKEADSIQHILNLNITELFIICHELGHVINGDFNDINLADEFFDYVDEANHRKEHMADITGFLLMLLTLEKRNDYSKYIRLSILFNIIHLIDLLYSLQETETESHPHPIRRAYCIADHFYGPQWTELIEKSYTDTKIFERIKSNPPKIDSIENEITEMLYKWIELVWKDQKPSP